jgi:hypothetical protein
MANIKPWVLIVEWHDTSVEYFDTKSEACTRAIELKDCKCRVVEALSYRTFSSGRRVSSQNNIKG